MTRRVVEKLCTKKACVDFLVPIEVRARLLKHDCRLQGSESKIEIAITAPKLFQIHRM